MPSKNLNIEVAHATGQLDPSNLSPREREILRDVVHSYILNGEPVSSRSVSKHVQHGLSAASIRNVMADLEELGLLCHPHTSAGRVPTRAGYRFYVESLMQRQRLSAEERRYIDERLVAAAGDAEDLMSAATHVLSNLSQQVAVVMMPKMEDTIVRAVDFVPMGGRRVLCVLVAATGFVDHVVVETEEELPREDLVRISSYLTESFSGFRLRQIRDRLLQMMSEERARVDLWFSRAMDLAHRAVEGAQTQGLLVEGTSALLDRPELGSVEAIRRMLDTFADKAKLVRILNQCILGEGVRVLIGEDSDVTSALEFSLVATSYGLGEHPLGSLGIMGPSRMEYSRIIPLVRYLAQTVSCKLEAECRE